MHRENLINFQFFPKRHSSASDPQDVGNVVKRHGPLNHIHATAALAHPYASVRNDLNPFEKIFYWMFMIVFLAIANGAFAEESKNPLDHFLSRLESFQADFVQTLSNEYGVTLETSSGVVYMQNPGKFRWVYQEPYAQLIITDSKTLWLYDEDLAQVTVRDIEESINNTPAAIISGQENIDKFYVTVDMGNIEGYDWIELTPRDIENQYNSVRLGFNDDNLGMMVMFDNLGQVTRIDFLNPVRNKRFGGPLFTFEMPEGVDVIDERTPSE